MSTAFELACARCLKSVWIAQRGSGNPIEQMTLYTGEPETMEQLRQFLIQHRGHALVFDDSETIRERQLSDNYAVEQLDQGEPPNFQCGHPGCTGVWYGGGTDLDVCEYGHRTWRNSGEEEVLDD